MAIDLSDVLSPLSPLAAAGIDPDEALASGKSPMEILAARQGGMSDPTAPTAVPAPTLPPAVTKPTLSPTPATTVGKDRTRAVPGSVNPTGRTTYSQPAQAQQSATMPAATKTATGSATTPSNPRTAWSNMARRAFQGADTGVQNAGQTLQQMQQLAQQQNKLSTPTEAYDPQTGKLLPQYRPSVGQRILRGVQAFAQGGLPGVLDPAARGATPYGAPNRQYQVQDQQRQQQLAATGQQLQQEGGQFNNELELANAQRGLGSGEAGASKTGITPAVIEGAAKAGLKPEYDSDGNLTGFVDDTTSAAYQARQALQGYHDSMAKVAQLNEQIKAQGVTPGTPAWNQKQQQIAAERTRAQAYLMNAFGRNLGTTPSGGKLPGSTETPAGQSVGSAFQSQFTRQQGNVAQFNDVLGASSQLENAAQALVKKNGPQALGDPVIAAGLAQPEGTFGKWVQGQVANGSMTPAQRDYVTNLRAFRENLQALRKSAGGGVSDAQVDRLMEMAPGASTPDLDYLTRQLTQIRNTAGRLSKGIPNTVGGYQVETPGVKNNAASEMPPAAIIQKMADGQYVHSQDGRFTYQKKGGKLVPVGGGK